MNLCLVHENGADPQCARRAAPAPESARGHGGPVTVRTGSGRTAKGHGTPDSSGASRAGPGPGAGCRRRIGSRRRPGRTRRPLIVIDASAAVEWLLGLPLAEAVADRLEAIDETLHAPHLLAVEVAQVV